MGAEQLSLYGRGEVGPGERGDFCSLARVVLDAESWIDYAPTFLAQHESLFGELRDSLRWRAERRMMYEREVDVPRLYASLPDDGALPALLANIAAQVAERYRVPEFERIGCQLYRGGADSVAFHRDHMERGRPTLVAILSLGTPRRLLVRPHKTNRLSSTTRPRAFQLGWGDLFVMGGMCQRDWEHGIPKQQHAEPRMSCVFRYEY